MGELERQVSLERTAGVPWILLPSSQHRQRRLCALPFAVKPHPPSCSLATPILPLSHHPSSPGREAFPLDLSLPAENRSRFPYSGLLFDCCVLGQPCLLLAAGIHSHGLLPTQCWWFNILTLSLACAAPTTSMYASHGNPPRLRTCSPALSSLISCLFPPLDYKFLQGMFLKRHQMLDE